MGQFDEHKQKTVHKWRQFKEERRWVSIQVKTIGGNFFANYMFIFHKTEIQAAIFRCLRSLNLIWYKSFDKKYKKEKNSKDENLCFCTKSQQKKKWKYFHFGS